MDALTVEARAAGQLLTDKEALADAITRALYDEMPELTERYGDIGRIRCHEDVRYTLEHLIPAVELAQPDMFARYVRWLDSLLRARNVSTRDVVRSLEVTEDVVRQRFAPNAADAVATCIRAGLATLVGAPSEHGA